MTMYFTKLCVRRVCARYAGSYRTLHVSSILSKIMQYNLSDIGEGIREVTVKNWFVKVDDTVAQFDDICEVESDKAAVTITSRFDGKIKKLYYNVGEVALVGKPLVDIDVENEEHSSEVKVEVTTETDVKDSKSDSLALETAPTEATVWNKSLATPAVRRIAMEYNVKLSDMKGSGKHGRVMKEDILEFLSKRDVSKVKAEDINVKTEDKPERINPLTTIQRVMLKTMTESNTIPGFLHCDEVNITKLTRLRQEVKLFAEKKGYKLSFLPFILKAMSKGLLEYPIINSSFDETLNNIIYKNSHNIGIAVDSPSGLLVPNIKNLQNLTILEIAKDISRLQELASKGKLTPSDLNGGTFTVSNIGSIGGTYAKPLILPPQVCIVAIGKIQTLPRFDLQGNVVPTDVLYVSSAADHRLIDGATVARFTNVWKYYIENPSALMLDL